MDSVSHARTITLRLIASALGVLSVVCAVRAVDARNDPVSSVGGVPALAGYFGDFCDESKPRDAQQLDRALNTKGIVTVAVSTSDKGQQRCVVVAKADSPTGVTKALPPTGGFGAGVATYRIAATTTEDEVLLWLTEKGRLTVEAARPTARWLTKAAKSEAVGAIAVAVMAGSVVAAAGEYYDIPRRATLYGAGSVSLFAAALFLGAMSFGWVRRD